MLGVRVHEEDCIDEVEDVGSDGAAAVVVAAKV